MLHSVVPLIAVSDRDQLLLTSRSSITLLGDRGKLYTMLLQNLITSNTNEPLIDAIKQQLAVSVDKSLRAAIVFVTISTRQTDLVAKYNQSRINIKIFCRCQLTLRPYSDSQSSLNYKWIFVFSFVYHCLQHFET